jgi:putative RecB family exonuclease
MSTTPAPHPAPRPVPAAVRAAEQPVMAELDVPPELEPASPPLVDDAGRVRLSFSRIDTYQRCPLQFRFSYVDRLPGEPAPALSFGTSVHAALEAFYDRKLPECPSEEELLQHLYDGWDQSGFVGLDRDEQLAHYRHAQAVLRRYHARVRDSYRLPAATEAWFELPVEDEAVVVGSIDRVDVDDDGDLHVVDYKTNRSVKDRARVARSLQLSLYALACRHLYGRLPRTVSLDFVVAGVEVRVGVDELDLARAHRAVLDTARAVRAGAYEPTPSRLCDWCDHRALCPAWDGPQESALGPAELELDRLRRQVTRDVRALRELEEGVARLRADLDARLRADLDARLCADLDARLRADLDARLRDEMSRSDGVGSNVPDVAG